MLPLFIECCYLRSLALGNACFLMLIHLTQLWIYIRHCLSERKDGKTANCQINCLCHEKLKLTLQFSYGLRAYIGFYQTFENVLSCVLELGSPKYGLGRPYPACQGLWTLSLSWLHQYRTLGFILAAMFLWKVTLPKYLWILCSNTQQTSDDLN